jgi:hypothetical protein
MTPLVPIMLFGWVPFTVILFFHLKPHRAVLISVIGGWLLLPMTGYNVPGIPPYTKYAAISLGLVLGGCLSGEHFKADFKWRLYDLPMVLWCLAPIPTSLTNHLGLYDGISSTYSQIVSWGIPYLAGRIYFKDNEALRDLCLGIVIGGTAYALLCLYEIRMSPRLSREFYGFFAHDWRQHHRYGGWRPIVFMQHGLMVAVWMAASATAAFWLWRSRAVEQIKGIPMGWIAVILFVTAVLCKTASGWFALAIGCGGYFIYRHFQGNLLFVLLLLVVPLYIGVRISGTVPMDDVVMLASKIFDEERIGSLAIRLVQEDLFVVRTLESPLFGWGGYSRGWPVDPDTGKKLVGMVDSLWVITFSSRGFFGITTLIIGMLIGPWTVLRATANGSIQKEKMPNILAAMLSLIVILFMIDSLFNAMINPIYIMCSGALVGWLLNQKDTPAAQRDSRDSAIVTTGVTAGITWNRSK